MLSRRIFSRGLSSPGIGVCLFLSALATTLPTCLRSTSNNSTTQRSGPSMGEKATRNFKGVDRYLVPRRYEQHRTKPNPNGKARNVFWHEVNEPAGSVISRKRSVIYHILFAICNGKKLIMVSEVSNLSVLHQRHLVRARIPWFLNTTSLLSQAPSRELVPNYWV